ncbi:MAG: thioredoxin-like domain-containing protein [Bacteroidota bacterium]
MTKHILSTMITLVGVLFSLAFGQGHEITVKVKGFEGDTMYLANHYGKTQYMADTVQVTNGVAVFKGEEPRKGGIYLVVLPPDNNYFEIVLADDQEFTIETSKDDLVGKVKVTGSKENEVFYKNIQFLGVKGKEMTELQEKLKGIDKEANADEHQKVTEKLQALNQEINDSRLKLAADHPELFYSKVINAMRDPEIPEDIKNDREASFRYYRNHYFDNIDFGDGRLLRTPILHNKMMYFIEKLSYQEPDSLIDAVELIVSKALKGGDEEVIQYVTVTLLNKYAGSKIMGHDAIYVHIVDMVYAPGLATWSDAEQVDKIVERANSLRPTLLGNLAPQMVMLDTAGNTRNMHREKADYTILYFWDYDCGHCKKVTPALGKLYPKYADKNVKIWSVSINGDEDKWREKVKEYGLDQNGIINVSDHRRRTGFDHFYDINSTPRIFLLDKNKIIRAKQISVEQLDEILTRFMEKELEEAEKEIQGK